MNASINENEKNEITDEAVAAFAMKIVKAIKEEGSVTVGMSDGNVVEVNTIVFYDGEWYASNGDWVLRQKRRTPRLHDGRGDCHTRHHVVR